MLREAVELAVEEESVRAAGSGTGTFGLGDVNGRRAGNREGDMGVLRDNGLFGDGGVGCRVNDGMGGLLYCDDLLDVLLIEAVIDVGRVRAGLGVSESGGTEESDDVGGYTSILPCSEVGVRSESCKSGGGGVMSKFSPDWETSPWFG